MPKKFDREPVAWITRGGKHIPIFEGDESETLPENIDKLMLIEYTTRDVFKGKTLDQAINRAYNKFNNKENMFLGSGKMIFTKNQLRNDYILDKIKSYYRNKNEHEISYIIDRFKIPKEELLRRIKK